jgi:hypothetical protein
MLLKVGYLKKATGQKDAQETERAVEIWRTLLPLPVELGAWPAGMGKGKGEGGLFGAARQP